MIAASITIRQTELATLRCGEFFYAPTRQKRLRFINTPKRRRERLGIPTRFPPHWDECKPRPYNVSVFWFCAVEILPLSGDGLRRTSRLKKYPPATLVHGRIQPKLNNPKISRCNINTSTYLSIKTRCRL
jgi:hypothetical protein